MMMKAPAMMQTTQHQPQHHHQQQMIMVPRGHQGHQGQMTSSIATSSEVRGQHQPDLSHLTVEERAIIESVMMRQKAEEEEEAVVLK